MDERLAKLQAKEILHKFVDIALYEHDDIECPEEYWGMLIYTFLTLCNDDANGKIVHRAASAFLKKKWVLKDPVI